MFGSNLLERRRAHGKDQICSFQAAEPARGQSNSCRYSRSSIRAYNQQVCLWRARWSGHLLVCSDESTGPAGLCLGVTLKAPPMVGLCDLLFSPGSDC